MSDPLATLYGAFGAQLSKLYAAGADVTGEIRYLVLPAPSPRPDAARAPVAWPLDFSAASVSLTEVQAQQVRLGQSRAATGVDADRLRSIRASTQGASSPIGTIYAFTTVADKDGAPFQLFVRDAVPLSDPNGLFMSGVL